MGKKAGNTATTTAPTDDGTFDPAEAEPSTEAEQAEFFNAFLDGELGPDPEAVADAAESAPAKPAPKAEPKSKPKAESKPEPVQETAQETAQETDEPETAEEPVAAARAAATPEPIAADAPLTVDEIRELFGAVLPIPGQSVAAQAQTQTQHVAAQTQPQTQPAAAQPQQPPPPSQPPVQLSPSADPFDVTEDEYNALWADNGRAVLKSILLRSAEHGARLGAMAAQERMAREFPQLASGIAIEKFQQAHAITKMYDAHPELVPLHEAGLMDALAARIRADNPDWTVAQRIEALRTRALAVASSVRALRASKAKPGKPSAPARPGSSNGIRTAARKTAEAPSIFDEIVDDYLAAQ